MRPKALEALGAGGLLKEIAGDTGARALIGERADVVCEVPMDDDAVLLDVDTSEALKALGASSA